MQMCLLPIWLASWSPPGISKLQDRGHGGVPRRSCVIGRGLHRKHISGNMGEDKQALLPEAPPQMEKPSEQTQFYSVPEIRNKIQFLTCKLCPSFYVGTDVVGAFSGSVHGSL